MKKQMTVGIAAAAVVVLLGTPAMATAASKDSTTNPYGRTNGAVINPFKANGDVTNPYGSKTSGDQIDPFTSTNGNLTNPYGSKTGGAKINPFTAN